MSLKIRKPCPFCGDLKDLYVDCLNSHSPQIFCVFCWNCDAEGPIAHSEKELINVI